MLRADDILKKRRDRTIAIILSIKEREVDPLLTQMPGGRRASQLLRKAILDQVNDFYDMALDVSSSGGADGFAFNAEVWLPKIEGKLHELGQAIDGLAANGMH